MVGTEWAIEINVSEGPHDFAHVHASESGGVSRFMESLIPGHQNIPAVGKVDPTLQVPNHRGKIVSRRGAKRPRAEGDPIRRRIHEPDEALEGSSIRKDSGEAVDGPRGIVRMNGHSNPDLLCNRNDPGQKVG
jgi:hypothetical protein